MFRRVVGRKIFLITPSTRIDADPAPSAPDLGILCDGNSGKLTAEGVNAFQRAIADSADLITPADVAAIRDILAKYSGQYGGRTNGAGISTNDSHLRDLTRQIYGRSGSRPTPVAANVTTANALKASQRVAEGVAEISGMNKANADFWSQR